MRQRGKQERCDEPSFRGKQCELHMAVSLAFSPVQPVIMLLRQRGNSRNKAARNYRAPCLTASPPMFHACERIGAASNIGRTDKCEAMWRAQTERASMREKAVPSPQFMIAIATCSGFGPRRNRLSLVHVGPLRRRVGKLGSNARPGPPTGLSPPASEYRLRVRATQESRRKP
jgi:hypothetical protein